MYVSVTGAFRVPRIGIIFIIRMIVFAFVYFILRCLVMHYAKLNTGLEYSFMFDIANVDCNFIFSNILYYYLLLN